MKARRTLVAVLAVTAFAVSSTPAVADRPDRLPAAFLAVPADPNAGGTIPGDDRAAGDYTAAASTFGCFRGDTKVATEAGMRSIRDIRVGDRVWSWDDAGKTKLLSRVTQTFAYPARELRTLIAGGETFHVTDRHPFWVEGRGWVEASKLAAADELRTGEGGLVAVKSNERADFIAFYKGYDPSMDRQASLRHPLFQLQRVSLGTTPAESGIVYNIEVDGVHNYYVGERGILVHNK